jgi:hypothetical protein
MEDALQLFVRVLSMILAASMKLMLPLMYTLAKPLEMYKKLNSYVSAIFLGVYRIYYVFHRGSRCDYAVSFRHHAHLAHLARHLLTL